MQEGQLLMTQAERDRLVTLRKTKKGLITRRQAAEELGLDIRQVKRLVKALKKRGDKAVVHGLRGKPSNQRIAQTVEEEAIRILSAELYKGFRPTLAAEYLADKHGIRASKETVRQWMIRGKLWRAKAQKVKAVHVWRPRRSCWGELVQWDTSVHAWLEERGPEKMYLIALIDDATSRLFARFVPADSTEHHMRELWAYVEHYGRPQAVYTDKASLFQPTLAPGWKEEEPGPKTETQMGRAFRELGIQWIAAHSPQAKGRIERCFGTLQDRLVKGLRKAGARTQEDANQYLGREFLKEWNERFTVQAASETDAHRPLGKTLSLESTLSHMEQRQVMNDYTVAWEGRRWQIPKAAVQPGLRRSSIRIESRLDGTLQARIGPQFVELTECEGVVKTPAMESMRPVRRHVPAPGQSQWMNNFSVARQK